MFTPSFTDGLFRQAREHKRTAPVVQTGSPLKGKLLLNLFYEPSTRTRLSFDVAAKRFGMEVVTTENAKEFSSAVKGESLEDTIRVVAGYGFSAIVMRHDQEGAAALAASLDVAPIINAGDGTGQHPTQALLDLFTIQERLGTLSDLRIVIGGDLARGRTARSLAYLLARYPGNTIWFVAPRELGIGDDIKDYLRRHDVRFYEREDPMACIDNADVVYWTRVQLERPLRNGQQISRDRMYDIQAQFRLTKNHVQCMTDGGCLLHPLPRVHEIATSVDADTRAMYFEQAHNGVPIRMALLEYVLGVCDFS